jgi:hypothetical protein
LKRPIAAGRPWGKRLRQARTDKGQRHDGIARDLQAEINHRMKNGKDRNSERRNRAR